MVRVFLVGSILVGGPAYFFFAAGALFYLRRRPPETYRSASAVVPLLFALWLAIWVAVRNSVRLAGGATSPDYGEMFIGLIGLTLAIGYGYAAFVELARWSLTRTGVIRDEPAAVLEASL